jgi:NlpC/P60 family protein
VIWFFFLALWAGCSPSGGASGGAETRTAGVSANAVPGAPLCAPFSETSGPLPGVKPEQLTLEYWLTQLSGQYDLDQVLLSPQQIATLNASLQVPRDDYHPPLDLAAPLDASQLAGEVEQRRVWAREKLSSGEYVSASGAALPRDALEILGEEVPLGNAVLHVALKDVQIRCAPIPSGFYSPALDLRLDRNACSTLRAQDVVRVVAAWPNGMRLVQAEYSFGWLPADAQLSPALPERLVRAFVHGPAVQVVGGELTAGEGAASSIVAVGTRLPAADKRLTRAHVATAAGFVTSSPKQAALLRPTARGLTRRALFEEAWRYIGTPYGLGDTDGGRDCSRLLLDSFEAFDLHLPRHSSWQSKAGSFWIDIAPLAEAERLPLLDAAAKKGIVLLHFPGHIMLYLGRNELGTPMVLHALGEYAVSCPGKEGAGAPAVPAETLVRVRNATVSDLELGRGTSRTALLSRLTRITVIGGTPGVELAGVAQLRPAAESPIPPAGRCADSEKAAIYAFPEQPNQQQALRIVSSMSADPGPARLTLIDPDGQRVAPELVRLGGPPFGQVATVQSPRPGKWKAIVADGDTVLACQQLLVRSRRPKAPEPDAGPIWKPKYKWHVANENLYALFVERLFDYPMAEDRVWSNLHSLLRDADRNILFDYRGLDEDNQIELVPDCADLPYALRAYFAWKMRLPFGYRRCTRGRAGRPPSCDEPGAGDNLMSRLELPGKGGPLLPRDDVQAFGLFVNTYLATAVHSSSGRTSPEDELSDLYPVPLTREALKPGIVFADPYGHLLVLADWIPQGLDGTGMLVGVDAQPDGSIGQRRFWRGSFLFNPETTGGGAGFKAFRPRLFVEEPVLVELGADGKALSVPLAPDALQAPAAPVLPAASAPIAAGAGGEAVPGEPVLGVQPTRVERVGFLTDVQNEELRRSRRYPPLSLQQYEGTSDHFYDTLERLINPRPLEPKVMLRSLIDALGEAATRRVSSVDNAEKWFAAHPGEVVEMPEGDRIFLSVGAWEDFSTPSRDLRLLIAIDTVLGFAESVRAAPERFGLRPEQSSRSSAELSQVLASELSAHTLSYTRSDGSLQRLTLKDVVERAQGLEVAYNPNDCSELRWAAPPGSSELESCRRHAPPEQRARMDSYRAWFSTRNRPPQ